VKKTEKRRMGGDEGEEIGRGKERKKILEVFLTIGRCNGYSSHE